jgi:putative membrane-bound dehydrogenase-like protein
VLLHRDKFEPLPVASQTALSEFTKRGGGVVAVNAAVAAGPVDWGKATLGGAWDEQDSREFKSLMMLYVVSNSSPIVKDSSPFDITDETLYDLDLADDIFVLGSAFTPKGRDAKRGDGPKVPDRDVRASIYDLQPQMWTWQAPSHRAAVFLQGAPETLAHASMRSFILRSVAWTGNVEDVDAFCSKQDLADLRYPAGGPMRAKDAIKQYQMQPGFVASVIAEEPMINKPIAVQWDGKGRMWVAETPEYPNGRRPLVAPSWKETGVLDPGHYDRPARDSISILEDTDGDGQMDKKTPFYTGLELVTGFCMHGDGVIAVAQPEIVWIRDKDGDGKAETVETLFGGFSPGDTHFVANHFVTAPDGWIYASNGSGAEATHPKTKKVMARLSPGVFRFKPDGSAIEQVASQGGNTFGCEVTSEMEIFHGKATSGNPIQHVVLPEWVLAKAPNTKVPSMESVNPGRKVNRKDLPDRAPIMQIDQVGRYTAACSTAVYEGGAWPKEFNGKMFLTEPILDIIHQEALKPEGPTYKGELVEQDEEWLRSTDLWYSPIDVTFGPDGAMYVLDFYTPVVTHNDTRGPQHSRSNASVRPDRDQYFGRIYKLQHQAATKLPNPDLTTANGTALVAAFKHPNKTVRFNALRILVEKSATLGSQALPALTAMATNESFVPARISALWALQRMDQLKPAVLQAAFQSSEAAVRKNAMLIAEAGGIALDGKQATAGLTDKDARVQLATLRALGASAMSPEASAALLANTPKLDNDWAKAAAAAAGARNPSSQLESILADASNAGHSEDSVRSLAASLGEGDNREQLLGVLQAAAKSPNPTLVAAVLNELGKTPPAAPRNRTAALDALRALLTSSNKPLAISALPLAVAWDQNGTLSKEITPLAGDLMTVAKDSQQAEDARIAAIQTLLGARSSNKFILPNIISLLEKPLPEALAKEVITSLAATGEAEVGTALLTHYSALPASQQEIAFTALVSRPEWAKALLTAMRTKKLAATSFAPGQISRLTAHPDAETVELASTIFGRPGDGTNASKDELIAKLLPEVTKPADLANGKVQFTALCSTCHVLNGEGHVFGPDLGGIGSHPTLELLTHIVNPNLVVDDEHRTWNITMKDGTQHSALIASENESRVQIRQPGGVTTDLRTADIASRKKGDNSLMPEGLEAIGTENLRDLIGYIHSCATKTEGEAPEPKN